MQAKASKPRINLEDAHVLLVESSPQGMDILLQTFTGFGVGGMTRAGGIEEAWKLLRIADFDLIVCGASLTDGSGFDFIAELRRSSIEPNRFSSIIVLSGHTPMSYVQRARDCGASFVIAKPISPRVLLERIQWIARVPRVFIEAENFAGPDRRFQNRGPPAGVPGRRGEDALEAPAVAPAPEAAVEAS